MKAYENVNQIFLYAVFLVFIWCWVGCSPSGQPIAEQNNSANGILIEEFTSLVNEHRVSVGCGPLSQLDSLAAVAQQHSEDMLTRQYFNHIDPDGRSPFDRIVLANINGWTSAGENIADYGENIADYPSGTARQVLDTWLASPGHKANIENCAYTHHGVGIAGDRYWTHMFLTEK